MPKRMPERRSLGENVKKKNNVNVFGYCLEGKKYREMRGTEVEKV